MTAPLRSHGVGKPPRRRVILRMTVLAWLTGVWVLLWGNLSWANVLGGLVVAIAITMLLPLPPVAVQGRVRFISLAKLLVAVCYYSILSSLQAAWLAIRPAAPPATGVMRRQVAIKSDLVFTLMVDALNLVPGTMVIDMDTRRRLLYIHVLDLGSERSVAEFNRLVDRYEKLFHEAFEREEDWAPDTRTLNRPKPDQPATPESGPAPADTTPDTPSASERTEDDR
ncbi:Na+/H+ antiporter subunit E [Millisia brevis]|uniref:Na+/H+ antiporter subunit E n=1 Tax=Millisia brevis TaxID=264148 RepID=UPI0009FE06E7|nr:Na+/H+ antiporter subunit E [Millisia brevis]